MSCVPLPLGYYAIQKWSSGFAHRVPISPVVFIVGSLIVIFIAAIIIGMNAAKVAMQNPVKSLRSE
jgi:putative ABC transport system permease protein